MSNRTLKSCDADNFINAKADFTQAYNAHSPLQLLDIYARLDYKVPYHVEHFIQRIIDIFERTYAISRPVIADIGCAHGYNSLILKHRLSYNEILDRARRCGDDYPALVAQFKCSDQAKTKVTVIGSDVSPAAIEFCRQIGVHDVSFCANLESEEAPGYARASLARINLVLSSGVYGYIGEQTMERLHSYIKDPEKTWFCNFVLRPLDYSPTTRMLADRGYRTFKAPVVFPHRRFESAAERDKTLKFLMKARLDSAPEDTTGYLHTYLYISMPKSVTPAESLDRFWEHEVPLHKASRLFVVS